MSILWRRLDRAGHEACRLARTGSGFRLEGCAVFEHEKAACRLDYRIEADGAWRTVSALVEGFLGDETVRVGLAVDSSGGWSLNGTPQPAISGRIDLDLNFSPSTNLLPIRRLALAVGQEAAVRAAWLRFPSFTLEPLEQTYRRTSASIYRYESAGGTFVRDLDVDDEGFVRRYPDFWEAL